MQQPGATPQEVEVLTLEALKARNEVAVSAPQDQPAGLISRLQRSTVCSVRLLGRCPSYYISRLWRFQTNSAAYRGKCF
jgi:hypothetical protein